MATDDPQQAVAIKLSAAPWEELLPRRKCKQGFSSLLETRNDQKGIKSCSINLIPKTKSSKKSNFKMSRPISLYM